ncbi:MAG: penicillin-binding transpeptidase domain-containing protein, partial [Rhodanobacter sp.]
IKGVDNDPKAIITPQIAGEIIGMMETVTAPGGTAPQAQIANYMVAGKTGTAHKASLGGYSKNNYTSAFAGVVPASNPRLVGVVIVDDPQKGSYYGALVSGPVFSRVLSGALRLLDVPPDNIGRWYVGGPLQGEGGLVGSKSKSDEPIDDDVLEDPTP